jgi:alcohol dehydrogenase (NADP+)
MNVPSYKLNNGCVLPGLGLGTWKSEEGQVATAIKEAVRCGYRHIDCAYMYGNQKEIGQALKECFQEGLCKREDLFITSKLWNDSHHFNDVGNELQQTLDELQLDYLDMYLIHWPVCLKKGTGFPESGKDFVPLQDLPISETWKAMEACVNAGKTKGIGVSNFSVKKLKKLLEEARIPPAINQVERHPYLAQPDLMDFCKANNIHVTGYSPLGSMDRPERLRTANNVILLQDGVVCDVAKKHGCTPAQVLLKWAIQTGASAIPKSVTPHRIAENLAAVNVQLDDDDMNALAKLDKHARFVDGSIWCMPGNSYTLENLWDES